MFTFKKNIGLGIVSTALLVFSGVALGSDDFRYSCEQSDMLMPLVCFYTDINYKGKSYCEAGQRTVNKVDKAPWRNNIESIRLFDGASVKIYNQYDRNGDYKFVERSIKQLPPEFFNKVRSYRTVTSETERSPIPPSWWYQEMCSYEY